MLKKSHLCTIASLSAGCRDQRRQKGVSGLRSSGRCAESVIALWVGARLLIGPTHGEVERCVLGGFRCLAAGAASCQSALLHLLQRPCSGCSIRQTNNRRSIFQQPVGPSVSREQEVVPVVPVGPVHLLAEVLFVSS